MDKTKPHLVKDPSEEYKRKVIAISYELCAACQPVFDKVDHNLAINALNHMHAMYICLLNKDDKKGAEKAARIQAQSLILNVKYCMEGGDTMKRGGK